MPATIHLIRHAQGYHNLGAGDWTLLDPDLTPEGIADTLAFGSEHFPDQSRINAILASPLRRTLHTAYLAFQPALTSPTATSPATIIALPEAQETSADPCDTGSPPVVLKPFIQSHNWPVDLSRVKSDWTVKKRHTKYGPDAADIAARARETRLVMFELAARLERGGVGEAEIVLVTHGSFLHFLTEDWEEASRTPGTGWRNLECRSYGFEIESDREVGLVERMESRERRGKSGVGRVDRVRQRELFEKAMEEWGAQGLERPDRLKDE